jgi:hypothetical protein
LQQHSAAKRPWIVGALAAILVLAMAGTASADITTTDITSPGDPYYDVANDANSTEEVTVRGTSDGDAGDVLDLVCYGSDNSDNPSPGQNVAVDSSGNWETQVDLFDISDQGYGCILRAVPDGTTPGNTSPYDGIRMLITYFEPPSSDDDTPVQGGGTVNDSFYADFQGLRGAGYFYEIDNDPIYEWTFVNPTNLFNNGDYNGYRALEEMHDWLQAGDQEEDRTAVRVDGENAYVLQTLPIANYDNDDGTTPPTYPDGVQSAQAAISQDDQGMVTMTERYPMYFCDDNDVFPPTTTSCESVESAGVRLERTKQTSDGGATVTVTDTFVSTDGAGHTVKSEYFNYTDVDGEEYPEYKMPGDLSYAQYEYGDLFNWPDFAPASMFIRDNSSDSSYTGAGAITEMQSPASTSWDSYDEWYTRQRDVNVPGGGSANLVTIYQVAPTSSGVEELAAAKRDPANPPVVSITAPTEGTQTGSDDVTVIGTASDDVDVAGLNVNGIPTQLNRDGTFTQEVSLNPGANAITATATDRSGNTAQSTVNVTYTPGLGTPPPVVTPPPGAGVSGVQLRTRRQRLRRTLRLKVRCVAGAQNGTLEVRTSKRPRRILGTKAFQCPAGGTRTVAFRLSKKRFRELRRKGRQQLVVDIVGRDLAGQAGLFTSRFTLTMPPRARRRG